MTIDAFKYGALKTPSPEEAQLINDIETIIQGKPIGIVMGTLITVLATGAAHITAGDDAAFDTFCNTVIEGLRAARDFHLAQGATKQ